MRCIGSLFNKQIGIWQVFGAGIGQCNAGLDREFAFAADSGGGKLLVKNLIFYTDVKLYRPYDKSTAYL